MVDAIQSTGFYSLTQPYVRQPSAVSSSVSNATSAYAQIIAAQAQQRAITPLQTDPLNLSGNADTTLLDSGNLVSLNAQALNVLNGIDGINGVDTIGSFTDNTNTNNTDSVGSFLGNDQQRLLSGVIDQFRTTTANQAAAQQFQQELAIAGFTPQQLSLQSVQLAYNPALLYALTLNGQQSIRTQTNSLREVA